MEFQADDIDLEFFASKEYLAIAQKIRGSVMLIGPLLTRFKKAFLPKPGGDKIGRRRIRHSTFLDLKSLVPSSNLMKRMILFTWEQTRLKGTYMLMDEISVTGTANVLMAAVLAEGTTTIYNAACETIFATTVSYVDWYGCSNSWSWFKSAHHRWCVRVGRDNSQDTSRYD